MAIFQVDSDALAQKSSEVRGTISRLQSEVDSMQSGLRALEGMWTGSAATNFQALIGDWRNTQAKVEQSLSSINEALNLASQQYAEAEQANTKMFTV
ncbi:WXG100 family type VII secretion target [Haematomicrobium sanguinis]|uniref:WXG100 family type VII secretion target n=1 Tax=Haematomicrobium sanguinis TaxID=479106 RepID=UPI00047B09A6|nr:WXG100 family type VII secretion target [Haematomicrobium sanguinis]